MRNFEINFITEFLRLIPRNGSPVGILESEDISVATVKGSFRDSLCRSKFFLIKQLAIHSHILKIILWENQGRRPNERRIAGHSLDFSDAETQKRNLPQFQN